MTPLSSGDFAVAVLHPGESSARSGRVSEAGAVDRVWLACGWAGPEVQPAHPMITPAAAQATAARARMPECYARWSVRKNKDLTRTDRRRSADERPTRTANSPGGQTQARATSS